MDTSKLVIKNKPLMIAHRGLSGIETENTLSAFVAAANRSYFGIETDVHKTADGGFVVMHDDKTGRVAQRDVKINKTSLEELRKIEINSRYAPESRIDLRIPLLAEYAAVCSRYGKTAVVELKDEFTVSDLEKIGDILKSAGAFENTVFISFVYENLVKARELYPKTQMQFLTGRWSKGLIAQLLRYDFDLDIAYSELTAERVAECHSKGIKVNCWTVDNLSDAERLAGYGVDFITSNIIE